MNIFPGLVLLPSCWRGRTALAGGLLLRPTGHRPRSATYTAGHDGIWSCGRPL